MNIEKLLPNLLEATRRKKITWREAMENTFLSRVGEQKFQIGQGFDEDSGESFYRFYIYIGGGDAPYVGNFIDTLMADRFSGPFSDLQELYADARRNALGLDEVISNIDDQLAKLLTN